MSHWLQGLNPEQKEAACHNHGPMLILAGAGSGKTTVLVSRTGRMIEEGIAEPHEICVLTFTNKAAKELQLRVSAKLGKLSKGLWAGTFHSFGLGVLREHHKKMRLPKNFGIMGSGDQVAIVKELLKNLTDSKDAYDSEKLISLMSSFRNEGRTKAKSDEEYEVAVEWLLPKYIKRLEALGVVDFDELLLGPIRLAEKYPDIRKGLQHKFKQLMVDEFQDTNKLQMKMVMLLGFEHKNISVVGDDDQSIYGWRGAEVSNILNFPNMFDECQVVRLERNYRSTPAILNVANAVISKNEKRHDKILRSDVAAEPGEKPELFVFENEDEEAERVSSEIMSLEKDGYNHGEFAILYRSNSQGALMEAELRKHKIPYKLNGGTAFFDRKETKDILAYIRCSLHPSELALRRIINTPHRGIGETTIERLSIYAEAHKVSFQKAVRSWSSAGVDSKIGKSIESLFLELKEMVPEMLNPGNDSPGQALLRYMSKIGYKNYVEKQAKDHKSAASKWAIVEIFANVFDSFLAQGGRTEKSIIDFIDAMELRENLDDSSDKDKTPKVQLLTFHACKGLEYPVCFMIGLEEDIIPHKTLGEDISEERRLFYVAVTRAKIKLIMSRARERRKYGRMKKSAPSRFLLEIPESMVQQYELGFRPVSSSQRKNLLADLYKSLDNKIAGQEVK
ncbi:MAG: ATP-dependent helicase [Bdellovibrionales bacterium]